MAEIEILSKIEVYLLTKSTENCLSAFLMDPVNNMQIDLAYLELVVQACSWDK